MEAIWSAFTNCLSPAPEGPGWPVEAGRPAFTLNGYPVRQVMIGNKLHPLTSFSGPRLKGKSHPPLNVITWRRSKSDDARKTCGRKNGTWLLLFLNPDAK